MGIQKVLVYLTEKESVDDDPLIEKFIVPNLGLDLPIYVCSGPSASVEQIEKRRINKILNARYNLVSQVQSEETQVIGIVVGTVVVNDYLELINRLK